MADNDPIEFVLYDTDLRTKLAILPIVKGKLYLEFQEPGSGEVVIPLDSDAAALVSSGRFIAGYYRGAYRGGFFVENLKIIEADESENGNRLLTVSGRGLMALLSDYIVWYDSSYTSTRSFQGVTKGYILETLMNEIYDRIGGPSLLDWDFSFDYDSGVTALTDNVNYNITVGTSYLDVIRMFAKVGDYEFSVTLQNAPRPPVLVSLFAVPIGTDKSTSVYFRIGSNCEEVSSDERGADIKNVLLAKFKDGYTIVSDSTSIAARRRRESFLNLEAAQSGDSAQTYAAAQLENQKDPIKSIAVKLSDNISPNVFLDYIMGDYVSLDKFGTLASYRVLGLQLDTSNENAVDVIVELNNIIYDNDLKMANDLDWLLDQWNTARDANLTEVKEWISIGTPNGEVYALYHYGNYLYVGGNFTAIGSLSVSYVARYDTTTGLWSSLPGISQAVKDIIDVSGTIYAITTDKIYRWDTTVWTLIGTTSGGGPLKSMATDGTDLYVCGTSFSIAAAASRYVYKWNGSWTAIGDATGGVNSCNDIVFYSGSLYAAFSTTVSDSVSALKKLVAGTWQTVLTTMPGTISAGVNRLLVVGDNLIWIQQDTNVVSWNGSASTGTIIGVADQVFSSNGTLASYLSDVYVGGDFSTIDEAIDANNIARYSGGTWNKIGTGTSIAAGDKVNSIVIIGSDIYIGGLFSTVDGKPMSNLSVYVTSFQSLVDHLTHDNQFDLAAAIHNASASAITDNDEVPFWEDVSAALRKITWANIKATLKTYFDAIYAPIAKGVTNGDSHDHNGGDGAQIAYSTLSGTPTIREVLSAARTYYVRTDGSDSNTGLANTAGGAFLTIQKAVNVAASLDLTIYNVTIQLADGTYTENITLKSAVGAGEIIIQGNNATPANVVITCATGNLISAFAVTTIYTIKDVKLTATSASVGVLANATTVYITGVNFGATFAQHISAANNGTVYITGNYTISAGAGQHWVAQNGNIWCQNKTVTLTGTPAFSTAFAYSTRTGVMVLNGNTFSGSATGTRYSAATNSVMDTNGGGATYLPGDAAGSTATGGQYV